MNAEEKAKEAYFNAVRFRHTTIEALKTAEAAKALAETTAEHARFMADCAKRELIYEMGVAAAIVERRT